MRGYTLHGHIFLMRPDKCCRGKPEIKICQTRPEKLIDTNWIRQYKSDTEQLDFGL